MKLLSLVPVPHELGLVRPFGQSDPTLMKLGWKSAA
jgi:hypothetical protein